VDREPIFDDFQVRVIEARINEAGLAFDRRRSASSQIVEKIATLFCRLEDEGGGQKHRWLDRGSPWAPTSSSCAAPADYVGRTDGWQNLSQNFKLDWEFASASKGNVALAAEIDLPRDRRFTLGLAFGIGMHRAVTCLYQSLGIPFVQHSARFMEQWGRACGHMRPLDRWTADGGQLAH